VAINKSRVQQQCDVKGPYTKILFIISKI